MVPDEVELKYYCKLASARSHVKPHYVLDNVEFKYCIRCQQWKPVSQFLHHSRSVDGYYLYCSVCHSQHPSTKKYRESDKAKQVKLARSIRYAFTPQRKSYLEKYKKSESRHQAILRYSHSDRGRKKRQEFSRTPEGYSKILERIKRYQHTDKGKALAFRQSLSRHYSDYYRWVRDVTYRDIGHKSIAFATHHILSFNSKGKYDEFRTDIQNGICLSQELHRFITSAYSLHYVSYFYGVLSSCYGYDYSCYPIPDVSQWPIPERFINIIHIPCVSQLKLLEFIF